MTTDKVLTLLAVKFKLQERGTITSILFKLIQDNKAQIRFVRTLVRLYYKQETRQQQAFKRKRVGLVASKAYSLSFLNKQKKSTNSVKRSLLNQDCDIINKELNALRCENVLEVQSQQLFPIIAFYLIYLIYIGNVEFLYKQRIRCI